MLLTTRSVLITVLLGTVVLVGAAAAPAGASPTDATRTVDSDSVEPGGTVTVTASTTTNGSVETLTFVGQFDGDVAEVSLPFGGVTIDGEPVTPTTSSFGTGQGAVVLQNVAADSTVEVTYEITANASAAVTANEITINGSFAGPDRSAELGMTTIPVVEDPLRASASFADQEVAAGESTTLTTTIENPRPRLTVINSFEGPVADASVVDARVDGESTRPPVANATQEQAVIGGFTGLSTDDTVVIEVELTAADDASGGASITATGQATSGSSTGTSTNATISEQDVTVTSPSPTERYDTDGDGVGTNDLVRAINDFANNSLDPSALVEVINAFASA
jgi:hypothetical protein